MTASSEARIVGREAVLTRLRHVLDATNPAVAVLRGEGGMGKTTILDAVVAAAFEGALRVRHHTAREIQQDVPFALVADLFDLRPQSTDPLRASLGRLVVGDDTGGPFDPFAKVLAVAEGVIDLLMSEALGTTSALVIDDLHRADRPSLQVVDRLLRRAAQLGLGVVLATRPSNRPAVQGVVDQVVSVGGVSIDLEPLPDHDVVEILSEVLGASPGPNLTALARGAAGNPLYVAELARAAAVGGELHRQGTVVDLRRSEAPVAFGAAVLARLADLPAATITALQAGAILGTAIDLQVVAALIGSDPVQVLEALRPATIAGMVVDRAGTPSFRHELVRDALYQDMPKSVRRQLHRVAAARLSETGVVAAHVEAAGPPYSDADLDLLRAGGERALRVDGRRGAALLEAVLSHTPPDSAERVRLRALHAHALVLSGDLDAAADALSALERDGFGTDVAVGLAVLEAQGARDQPDPDLVARLQVQTAQLTDEAQRLDALGAIAYHAVRADPARFRTLVAELPEDGPHLPLDARVHFLLARAMQRGLDGDLVSAIEAARHAYRLARDEEATPQVAVRAAHVLGVFGGDLEPFRAEAITALGDATRWAEDSHQAGMIPIAHALLANAYWAGGDRDQAEAEYRAAALAAEDGEVPRWQAEALFSLSHMAADRGDIETAKARFDAWERVGWHLHPGARRGGVGGAGRGWMRPAALEARIAYGAGRDADAISAWSADVRDPETVPFGKAISAMDLTVAALALGDRVALEVAGECLRPLEGAGPPIGMIRPIVLAALDGDVEGAAAVAEQARITPVYGFAKMAEIAGLVARDAGDKESAVRWLREAFDGWDRSGAAALARRTASWLRALGVRTRGRIGERPTSGWESLSDAEHRVVAGVAEGLLYREVAERLHISRRTVETHVASALRKLDLRNRGELAAGYWRLQAKVDTPAPKVP